MRAFVIADASTRKARPVAVLLWEADPASDQGRFSLELASRCTERNLPLSLSFCLRSEGLRATPQESEDWVRSRIVPESRHNIAEVLRANGLDAYSVVGLLAAGQGRSSDDDFIAYEVELTAGLERDLSTAGRQSGQGHSRTHARSRADVLIDAVERQRLGGNVSYAVIELPDEAEAFKGARPRCATRTPAQRIGDQFRARRLGAGLTQKQLAARAGITQTVLSRIESGSGNPTLGLLEDIAEALGSNLNITLGGT